MTVKVRFAPSPTGKLHVGNIRTALVNWLFAKSLDGLFVLRIDDTDLERSTKENEDAIRADLTWLGMTWDDTFKQSERFARYTEAAEQLKAKGLLYPCYETAEELERRKKIALSRGKPPVYDRAALALSEADLKTLEAEGRKPHWRFKLSGGRAEWNDLVRGQQSIDTSSVSDPVLIREDGSFLYTMPSVADDIDAKITHVIRGEDHVTNSGAQIEIFLALGAQPPEMAHMPLLIGADGQGLSKRLGSLSAEQLRNEGYEPMAILSLLAKIGTSDPVEARESLAQLTMEFSFSKMGRAPARFDENELDGLNAQIVHGMSFDAVKPRLAKLPYGDKATPEFWDAVKGNLKGVPDAALWLAVVYGGGLTGPELDADDQAFIGEAAKLFPAGDVTATTWKEWVDAVKAKTGRKGKGLFMPLRRVLTDQEHGPEMDKMLVLIGGEKARARLVQAAP
ncbi:MAG: glutamate--tRNA ligase [Hyphomonadaceae bacterium]|nr:glutamate--tRNA ligase [Hyphomonadaceae bacterium]MBP9234232.1 glutamate--tRNA ligase [Hyphomonadaceae bacterium]